MQIEKNIAAMLQSKMKETGKTKLEFSKELGIPRSTLQGYLKGDKCLRSDSIEEIAKRLDLSPAQLISGPVYAEEFVLFSMDALQEELRMLHPQAQGLAREAAALLRAAFLDVHPTAAKTVDPEGLTYRHIPYEAHGEARMLYAYGILVQKYLQTHGAQGRKQGCPQRGQPCAGKDQAVVFATFSTKRWRMAATCALVALPVGRRRPSEPLTSFSATAQLSGALA